MAYTDLSSNDDETRVIQDAAGNDLATIAAPGRAADTFRSATSVSALAATTTNLVLTGSRAINGAGNAWPTPSPAMAPPTSSMALPEQTA